VIRRDDVDQRGADLTVRAAARALAVGDPLAALEHIALRRDAPALALRGIAMAQLGDFARARGLLGRAARAFGPHDAVAGARCVVARAEIALACRDFSAAGRGLEDAANLLAAHGDAVNALFSGLESNGKDLFFCGSGAGGKVRAVRRPRRA
jgi:hypothetical protein